MNKPIARMLPLLFALVWCVSACTTLSSMHNAHPVAKGKTEFALATGLTGVSTDEASGAVPTVLEFQMRHGLTDNLDLGVHAYIPGLQFDLNWMVIGSPEGFGLSINPAFSGLYFSSGDSSTFLGWGWLGVLMDLVHTDSVTLTVGPRGGYGFATSSIDDGENEVSGSSDGFLVGGMVGLRLQLTDGFALMPEFNVYYNSDVEGILYNGNLAFVF